MTSTILYMSMSLDGFVAGPNESVRATGSATAGAPPRLAAARRRGRRGPARGPAASTAQVLDEFMSTGRSSPAGGPSIRPAAGAATTTTACRSSSSAAEPSGAVADMPLVTYLDDVDEAMTRAKEAAGDGRARPRRRGRAARARRRRPGRARDPRRAVLSGRGAGSSRPGAHIELERTRVLEGEEASPTCATASGAEHRRGDLAGRGVGVAVAASSSTSSRAPGMSRASASPLPTGRTGRGGRGRPGPAGRARAGARASAACSRAWRTPSPCGWPSGPRASCPGVRSRSARRRPAGVGSSPRIRARRRDAATAARSDQSGFGCATAASSSPRRGRAGRRRPAGRDGRVPARSSAAKASRWSSAATWATMPPTPMPARCAARSSSARASAAASAPSSRSVLAGARGRTWSTCRCRAGHGGRRAARRPQRRAGASGHESIVGAAREQDERLRGSPVLKVRARRRAH